MPIDLVIVRHGESEGNLAQDRSKGGDDTDWNKGFGQRHTSKYRLTDVGRQQATIAGAFLEKEFGSFDRYFCSEYVRARETAALLGLGGQWSVDFYLREQDMGILGSISKKDRISDLASELKRRELDEFYWAPPGGESVANACLRVNRIISQLRRDCSGFKVILVAHGNIIMGFRVCIEHLSTKQYEKAREKEKAFNCQILHYTRRDPYTGDIHPHLCWMRSFVPWDLSQCSTEWKPIIRTVYTDEALLAGLEEIPQIVNNMEDEWPPNLKSQDNPDDDHEEGTTEKKRSVTPHSPSNTLKDKSS